MIIFFERYLIIKRNSTNDLLPTTEFWGNLQSRELAIGNIQNYIFVSNSPKKAYYNLFPLIKKNLKK